MKSEDNDERTTELKIEQKPKRPPTAITKKVENDQLNCTQIINIKGKFTLNKLLKITRYVKYQKLLFFRE